MPVDLSKSLVIGISSRALFDLEAANRVFEEEGEDAYAAYQQANEEKILAPGIGFRLIQAIQGLNAQARGNRKAEVVVASRNSPATSIRLFKSIEHHRLDIQRAILTSGTPVARYLKSFCVDLYLSAYESDVEEAIRGGIAAAVIYQAIPSVTTQPVEAQREPLLTTTEAFTPSPVDPCEELRIAFDGDNVLFGGEAQDVYDRADGENKLETFLAHEVQHASRPLSDGPFAKFLRTLAVLQKDPNFDKPPIRTALVTARSLPAHLRVLNTFRAWDINVDEAFFMGGVSKAGILAAFQPHIYFDDQESHCKDAAQVVSTGKVPISVISTTDSLKEIVIT
ncbi:5'-nucleotidase [Aquisphaera insulae]|uniref:5'-nucleotidase n=1 Tax=Aquisphaera insulae TaxID=2712864 RepID=UPI0013E9FA02|nr:5'-nucleotidase [Aquisphaera insulae]